MDAISLAEYLLKNIRERKGRMSSAITDGSISSWDEYRFVVGELRGMSYGEEIIKSAMKGLDLEDDE
jgi:hypothetical protein|tara:strand:- start:1890 stop:2090 length:201 start_codon:yes stop_codon:yes gene_type:complete